MKPTYLEIDTWLGRLSIILETPERKEQDRAQLKRKSANANDEQKLGDDLT